MPILSRRGVIAGGGGLLLAGCASTGDMFGNSGTSRLYYLSGAKVCSIDAEGGAPKTLVDLSPKDGSRGSGLNDGIALDLRRGHVYWSNMGRAQDNDGWIKRANLDGSNVIDIVGPGGAFTPKQIKLDEAASKIYWSDREGMSVRRCNFDGSNIETLVQTGDPEKDKGDQSRWCVGIALDTAQGHVYWTQKGGDNAGQGMIRRAAIKLPAGATPANRTDIETLFAGMPEPIDLDLDLASRQMFWTDRGDNTISRAPMEPSPRSGEGGFDPKKRSDRKILLTGLGEAIGITLDFGMGRMAWTTLGGDVGLANLNGTGKRMLAEKQGSLTGISWS